MRRTKKKKKKNLFFQFHGLLKLRDVHDSLIFLDINTIFTSVSLHVEKAVPNLLQNLNFRAASDLHSLPHRWIILVDFKATMQQSGQSSIICVLFK